MDKAAFDGGAHNAALLSAIGLSAAGIGITVFAGTVDPTVLSYSSSTLRFIDAGSPELLDHRSLVTAARVGLWNVAARARCGRVLQEMSRRDTVVHVHSWQKALSISVVQEALQRGFRVVLHVHGYELICPAGTLFDYSRLRICEKTPLSAGCVAANCDVRNYGHKIWRVARQIVQQKVLDRWNVPLNVIAGSEFAKARIAPYLAKDSLLRVVPSPIDVPMAPFTWSGRNSFIFVGRLSREKGAAVFALAAKLAGAKAVFAGDGSEREVVRRINPSCEMTGWLGGEELRKRMLWARALVFPSVCLETYGRSVAEAAALGRSSLVSAQCAAADLVNHGRTGLLFRCGDAESLAGALRELSDASYAQRLGKGAYDKYWQQPSTINGHVAALLEIYEAVLNKDDRRSDRFMSAHGSELVTIEGLEEHVSTFGSDHEAH